MKNLPQKAREGSPRPRVRGERGLVGDGDGAEDGQSEGVAVVGVGAIGFEESSTPRQHAAGQGGGSETRERRGFRAREDWHGAPRTANDTYPEGGRRSYGRDVGPGTVDFVRERATGHANCSYRRANPHAYGSPRLPRTRVFLTWLWEIGCGKSVG